jgi:hypothetical protein
MKQEELAQIKRLNQEYEEKLKRIETYKGMYDEKMADKLGRAHAEYSWVAPEVLIPIVLSGQESMLPEVAKISAREMMATGLTPHMLTETYQRTKVPRVAVQW